MSKRPDFSWMPWPGPRAKVAHSARKEAVKLLGLWILSSCDSYLDLFVEDKEAVSNLTGDK